MVRASTQDSPAFRLDILNECLWCRRGDAEEERICLAPRTFAVLRFLMDQAGRLVTEDELLAAAWPRACVQPEAVKAQIYEIRKLLGDDPKNPRFIETVSRRGYRFIAPAGKASARTSDAVESASRRLVGREVPLETLRSCLRHTVTKRRQIVFITGETGIGKTTLADECMRRAAAEYPGICMARGQCSEGHGSQEPYYPVLEAIGQLCRGPDGARFVQTLAVQAPTWLAQFPDLGVSRQRDRSERELLGAPRERMLREIGVALETFSCEHPLLLVFEDLHWADPFTVDCISALARRRGAGKLMLLGTYRPADVARAQHPLKMVKQDLLVHQLCSEIALKLLTEAEVAEYLAVETPGAPVPEGLATLVYRYSEGNPLFMLAALDHMRNRDLIAIENGAWRVKVPLKSIDLEAPENVRQMIELEFERLSPQEQRVLEIASLTGVTFKATVEALGTNVDLETFEGICDDLSRRQLIVRRSPANPDEGSSECYEFAHALYREVLYRRRTPGRLSRPRQHIDGSHRAKWQPAASDAEVESRAKQESMRA